LRIRFVQEHRSVWPVETQCRVLRVTRAAFYKSLKRSEPNSPLKISRFESADCDFGTRSAHFENGAGIVLSDD
jgi:hypothetical protein